MDRLLKSRYLRPESAFARYGFAVVVVLVAFGLRKLLQPATGTGRRRVLSATGTRRSTHEWPDDGWLAVLLLVLPPRPGPADVWFGEPGTQEVIMDPAEAQARAIIAAALIVRGAVEVPAMPSGRQDASDPAGVRLRALTDYVYRLLTIDEPEQAGQ